MSSTYAGYPFLYQVGDVVKVREDLRRGRYYMDNDKYNYANATDDMIALSGKYVTIEKHYYVANAARYRIKEDHGCFYWTDEMFECTPEEELTDPEISWEGYFLN